MWRFSVKWEKLLGRINTVNIYLNSNRLVIVVLYIKFIILNFTFMNFKLAWFISICSKHTLYVQHTRTLTYQQHTHTHTNTLTYTPQTDRHGSAAWRATGTLSYTVKRVFTGCLHAYMRVCIYTIHMCERENTLLQKLSPGTMKIMYWQHITERTTRLHYHGQRGLPQ